MGLEPATMSLIGSVAGPALQGLFGGVGGGGQELSSFEGHAGADPIEMLRNANALIGRIGQGVSDRAASPISLPSSYVQQPQVFAGGGMPMPIGVVGSDPAIENPSLLSLQGLDQFKDIFSGLGAGSNGGVSPDHGYQPSGDATYYDDRYAVPKNEQASYDDRSAENSDAAFYDNTATRRKPAQLVRGADLLAEDSSADDLQRALGAAKLLMQSLEA